MNNTTIKMIFKQAYAKCKYGYDSSVNEIMKNEFHQRMDEILLIYSALFNISVNDSRTELMPLTGSEEKRK